MIFGPKLRVSVNLVDLARPVELAYGDVTFRASVSQARTISNEVANALEMKGIYAVPLENHEQRGEVVAMVGAFALELPRRLASKLPDRLARAAKEAEGLLSASGHFRAFSFDAKNTREKDEADEPER